jgi:hypothetical protein
MTTRSDTYLRKWGTMGVALLLAVIWLRAIPCLADSVTKVSFGGTPDYSYMSLSARPGATQAFLLMDVEDAAATVILFAGGDGWLNLNPLGFGSNLQANFVVRTRDLYTAHGIRVAIVDAPSDAASFLPTFRLTAEHAKDIQAVIAYLRHRFNDPVWLVGTSSGTVSETNVASRLSDDNGPDGLVLTSSVLYASGADVFATNLAAIEVPTLVVHHELDACPATLFSAVPALMAALTNTRDLHLVSFTGGTYVGNACDAFHYHGYLGIEAQVANTIADFILDHRSHGHGKHDN